MFGDSYEIGKDYANHAKDITPGETPSEHQLIVKSVLNKQMRRLPQMI